jgi:hypothetical protein
VRATPVWQNEATSSLPEHQRSVEPKTAVGKARSKQNARRHGLSIPVSVQPHLADLLHDLATALEQDTGSTAEDRRAVMVAVLEVQRARSVRALLLEDLLRQVTHQSAADASASKGNAADLLQHLLRADRYERRALSRRKSAIRSFSESLQEPG